MPSNAEVVFTPASLPVGFCHQSWQLTFNAFVAALHGYLPGEYNVFNYGSTTPAVEDQDKPWLMTNGDGTPAGWKIYYGGAWVNAQPHALSPGVIVDYYGTLADIPTLDGGTIASPFWRNCDGTNGTPDLRGRCTIGAGQGAGLTDRAINATGGEETHVLTGAEAVVQDHTHYIPVEAGGIVGDVTTGRVTVTDGSLGYNVAAAASHYAETEPVFSLDGVNDAHENMPPFHALYKIMRTNRLY